MSDKRQKNQAEASSAENLNSTDSDVITGNMSGSAEESEAGDTAGTDGKAETPDTEDGHGNTGGENETAETKALKEELEAVKSELEEQKKKCGEYLDRLQRTAAEFDNFKKRTVKEKEALYDDAVCDVIREFLPVIDNLERAQNAVSADSSAQSLKDGVEMVFKQFRDILKKIGVEEIKALNETFDPLLHNAVMHVEDESLGTSVIVEEFQKGYRYKDRVVRHSMVKVAN